MAIATSPAPNGASVPRLAEPPGAAWKILVVDDEPAVHQVTRLALRNQVIFGRPLLLLHSLSAAQALDLLREHDDTAVILLDVVMESEHAGLDLVRVVREQWHNGDVRIVLRTGQPGQAPEGRVMLDYEVNDYKDKTELTAERLLATVACSVRTYSDIRALNRTREGLQWGARASAALFAARDLPGLAERTLDQLAALHRYAGGSFLTPLDDDGQVDEAAPHAMASFEQFDVHDDGTRRKPLALRRSEQRSAIARARATPGELVHVGGLHAVCLRAGSGCECVLCLQERLPLDADDRHVLAMFVQSLAIAYENVQLQRQTAILAQLPAELPEPILRVSAEGRLLYANPSSRCLLDHWHTALGQRIPEPWASRMHEILTLDRRLDAEIAVDGRVFEVAMSPVAGADYVNLFGRDVTEYRQALTRLQHAAFHDELTGLHNRAYFRTALDAAIVDAERTRAPVGLILIDLDQFKQINDTFGHAAGDVVLCEVGRRLGQCVRGRDVLARLGGDEFGVLVTELQSPAELDGLAGRLRSRLQGPVPIDSRVWNLVCSIGVTSYPRDAGSAEDLMRCADLAMYHAKREGAGGVSGYDGEVHKSVRQRVAIELQLRQALKGARLGVHYQPIVRLGDRRLVGAEALVRMPGENGGEGVPPTQFVRVAEECGLIDELGDWVLQQALGDVANWHAMGHEDLRVAINLSGRQLRNPDIAARFAQALSRSGVGSAMLEIELTESVLIGDVRHALQHLWDLHALGARLSIDDFGTGYSSLGYLRSLPVSRLKIDRSFVADLPASRDALAIVDAILSLGKSLRLAVVAEGVETEAQAETLLGMGCHYAQGYLFGRPQPAPDFERYLQLQQARPEVLQ